MATDSKLISAHKAASLVAAGQAVRAGSPEYEAVMAELWERVAKKFVFVGSLGKWVYREKGTEKGQLNEWQGQRIVDSEFRTAKLVLSYGRKDGYVRARYESPELQSVSSAFIDQSVEKHRKVTGRSKSELSLLQSLVVDFMDTYPNKPQVIVTAEGYRVFNLWSEPKVKVIGVEKYHDPRWFLDAVDRFFGVGHTKERDYFLDWCAHLVCRPEVKMPVSVLLTSKLNGAGKNFIAESLKWMVGERNYKSLTADALKSGFHSFVPGTSLAVISELYEQGNYGFADKLKTWQSEDEQYANIKYGPMENVRNMVHFLAFSNRATPMNLDETDRRWFTFESPQREAAGKAFWEDKWRFLKHPKGGLPHWGALGSLRRWFQVRMDEIDRTERFSPFAPPPMTEHKQSIVDDSRSGFYLRVRDALESGTLAATMGVWSSGGLVSLSEIDGLFDTDKGFRMPGNSQKRADLEALGFEPVRTKAGRFWKVPGGESAIGGYAGGA